MALSTALEIRRTGGIDEADAHDLFRYQTEAALDQEVTTVQSRVVSWLRQRAGGKYTGSATSNSDVDSDFKAAEEYLVLSFLLPRLKIRKKLGTHWAVDQEEGDSIGELIDTELRELAMSFVEQHLTVESVPFAAPVLLATDPVDETTIDTFEQQLFDLNSNYSGDLVFLP